MSNVTIYCGVPGSGKTTLIAQRHHTAVVCSADSYFTDANGLYRFDAAKLPQAHALCLRTFVKYCQQGRDAIVVDNTNTTIAELAPYAAIALAYGCHLQIVTLVCDPAVAAARNTHGVPSHAILAMHCRLSAREMPPWWNHTEVRS